MENNLRPNILFIFTDEHSMGKSGCYGDRTVKTPAIDSLAATGVRFTKSYCTTPLCAPSRASLQTGRMPHVTGVNNNWTGGQDWNLPTIGQVVRKAGYACAWVGKTHLGCYYPLTDELIPGYENLNVQGAMQEYSEKEPRPLYAYNVGMDVDEPVTKEAIAYLKRKHDRPFFLAVSIMNPHDICFWEKIKDQDGWPVPPEDRSLLPPLPVNHQPPNDEPKWVRDRRPSRAMKWTEEEWRIYLDAYHHYIEHADANIGLILNALREARLEESTVIIYTSDHGEGSAAHKWRHKTGPYDDPVAVPFIVSWRRKTPAGAVDSSHLVSGLDVFSTVCGYAGIEPPEGTEGINLKLLIEDPNGQPGRNFMVTELGTIDGPPENPRSGGLGRIIRTHDFKYVRLDTNEEMLFNMKTDPGETTNLAPDRKHAGTLAELRSILRKWIADTGDHFPMAGTKTATLGVEKTPMPETGSVLIDGFVGGDTYGKEYAVRITGYLHPPASGDYVLLMTGKYRVGSLMLSDGEDPARKKRVVEVLSRARTPRWWAIEFGRSDTVHLEKGKKYCVELDHPQGAGDDYVAVAWRGPGFDRRVIGPAHVSAPDGTHGKMLMEFRLMTRRSS